MLRPLFKGINLEETIEVPPSPKLGDFSSTAAFEEARVTGGEPVDIALRAAGKIGRTSIIKEVKPVSGYLNFFVDWRKIAQEVFNEVNEKTWEYGKLDIGMGLKVLVEHTSANPNKPLHIGILRNTCLGDALSRLLKFTGYNVVVSNYIDDSGVQMAYNVLAHTELGYPVDPGDNVKFDHYCGKIYTEAYGLVQGKPELQVKLREIISKIEKGGNKYSKLAREIAEKVVKSQLETCWRINVFYDELIWETDIIRSGLWRKAFNELRKTGKIVKKEEGEKKGCWVFDLSDDPFFSSQMDSEEVLVRSDGTIMYVAKDIAFAMWKLKCLNHQFPADVFCRQPNGQHVLSTVPMETEAFIESDAKFTIAVIGAEQRHAQRVVKTALKLIGCKGRYLHYSYELVSLSPKTVEKVLRVPLSAEERKRKMIPMAGRRGIVVNADDVLNELKKAALSETRKRNPGADGKWVDETAEKIAVGALRFELLKKSVDKGIVFDLERALELKENTGPYIQYTYARACRIIEKLPEEALSSKLKSNEYPDLLEEEKELVKKLYDFPFTVKDASINFSPQLLCNYLTKTASLFNKFYQVAPVIGAETREALKFRAKLVDSTRKTLRIGLNLLGVPALERM